ncbi:MAG: hypothetical protein NT107_03150 [Planctomycetota bacterium]|nr:hypothetical protein [Planctomycetota bacterium]
MKPLRAAIWLLAALPAATPLAWAFMGSQFPEPWRQRLMLGEMAMQWEFAAWADVSAEHAAILGRLLPLCLLQIPGITCASLAAINALLAILIAGLVAGLLPRTIARAGLIAPFALALAGLLVATPALGASWLYGERSTLFLPPLLLLIALRALASNQPFTRSATIAFTCVALAPFTHANGAVVFLALIPALREAAARAESPRRLSCLFALLLIGNVGAALSIAPAGGIALGAHGILGTLIESPLAALSTAMHSIGSTVLDPIPDTDADVLLIGVTACFLVLLLLFKLRRANSHGQRQNEAPSWSCVWFGLLIGLWQNERLGAGIDAGTARSLGIGGVLLLVGLLGLLASRMQRRHFAFVLGLVTMLAIGDWATGFETLRLARVIAAHDDAQLRLPALLVGAIDETMLTVKSQAQFDRLRLRGIIPNTLDGHLDQLETLAQASAVRGSGGVGEGTSELLHGGIRGTFLGDTPTVVVAIAAKPGGTFSPLQFAWPEFINNGRTAPWNMPLLPPPVAGTRIRVLAYSGRTGNAYPIGPMLVVRNNRLSMESGK